MKSMKTIKILTVISIILAGIVSLIGICSSGMKQYSDVTSVYGETIKLYNKGLYARDSVSMANQAIAQDFITIVVGIPLVLLSLYFINKRKAKGLFLLTGTMAYILYTYTSYSFLMIYNPLYLAYVAIMAISFYAFVLCIKEILQEGICNCFTEQFPVKTLSRFLWATGFIIGLMWLGRIMPSIVNHTAPFGLEHYSTLGVQSLDLGFIVPACFVSGYLLKKKNQWGYLLSVVIVCKAVTMAAAVSAMAIFMRINGVVVSNAEMGIFPAIMIICIYFMRRLFGDIRDSEF
ncbi:hypothetical protein lbkm_1071 [Lachnospiraceae bacterium KM106-2]|nr:hypothetical protein lbkm_1071 [Lachnospiraceae bacterium KM106-2]